MPNLGQELATLDFEHMLGGPLIAVINAQAQAAMSTVNFIKEVGFEKLSNELEPNKAETKQPIYVTFKYPKEVSPYQPKVEAVPPQGNAAFPNGMLPHPQAGAGAAANDGTPANAGGLPVFVPGTAVIPETPAKMMEMKLEVPILTMLPIPFIRIDLTTIDFNAKINSVEFIKTDTTLKVKSSVEAGAAGIIPQMPFFFSAKLKVSSSYQRNTSQGINVERTYSMAVHIKAVQDEMPAGMEKILSILENAIREQPAKGLGPVLV